MLGVATSRAGGRRGAATGTRCLDHRPRRLVHGGYAVQAIFYAGKRDFSVSKSVLHDLLVDPRPSGGHAAPCPGPPPARPCAAMAAAPAAPSRLMHMHAHGTGTQRAMPRRRPSGAGSCGLPGAVGLAVRRPRWPCCSRRQRGWPAAAALATLLAAATAAAAERPEPVQPRADVRIHTVSGFSSGASLAVNHGVAFSRSVAGIGVLGGSVYGCKVLPNAADGDFTTCSYWTANKTKSAEWLAAANAHLAANAEGQAIDPPSHLARTPVYLFSGTRDSMVWQATMRAVEQQFVGLGAAVYSRFDIAAEHAWIVDNATCSRPNVPALDSRGSPSPLACCGAHPDLFGQCVLPNVTTAAAAGNGRGGRHDIEQPHHGCCGACAAGFCAVGTPPFGDCPPGVPPTPVDGPPWWLPPINNCGYDMAGDMLQFLLGGEDQQLQLAPRLPVVSSNLLAFSQAGRFHLPAWPNSPHVGARHCPHC
eukprot:SAG22_NODE_1005_length_6077_cov_3.132653_5_plen_477_part_00